MTKNSPNSLGQIQENQSKEEQLWDDYFEKKDHELHGLGCQIWKEFCLDYPDAAYSKNLKTTRRAFEENQSKIARKINKITQNPNTFEALQKAGFTEKEIKQIRQILKNYSKEALIDFLKQSKVCNKFKGKLMVHKKTGDFGTPNPNEQAKNKRKAKTIVALFEHKIQLKTTTKGNLKIVFID